MKKIAVIPGDGVGPEVTAAACRVLDRITELDPAIQLHTDEFPWSAESYLSSGEMMPPDGLEILSSYDALLLGAIGWPSVPDHITLRDLLLKIRGGFDQYVNLRPVRLLPGIDSPLAGRSAADIDMIFVREGTEGEYAGVGARLYRGTSREVALQTAVFSRHGCERVIRWAFELAAREGRPIASISKGNALNYSAVFWDQVFDEVAAELPAGPGRASAGRCRGHVHGDGPEAVRRRRGFQPLRGHPHRPRRGHHGGDGVRPERQPQPRARLPLDVRADPRLGSRHRGPGQGQPDRHDLERAR